MKIILSACIGLVLFLAIYGAGILGCQYYPSLSTNYCGQYDLLTVLPVGLLYIAIFSSMLIIPVAIALYLRLTVLLPVSKIFFGDYKFLESKISAWLFKAG